MIGVLFKKAEAAAAGTRSRANASDELDPVPSVAATSGWSAPVFSTARATTYSAATVIGAAVRPEYPGHQRVVL